MGVLLRLCDEDPDEGREGYLEGQYGIYEFDKIENWIAVSDSLKFWAFNITGFHSPSTRV